MLEKVTLHESRPAEHGLAYQLSTSPFCSSLSLENHQFSSHLEMVERMEAVDNILSSSRIRKRIHEAIVYIDKHYSNHISAESLSMEVNMSVSKLQLGLRLQTGYTLYSYQERVRIKYSKTLLEESDQPIRNIATKVGFKTHSHFGEVFKKITGLTPSGYRNRYGC